MFGNRRQYRLAITRPALYAKISMGACTATGFAQRSVLPIGNRRQVFRLRSEPRRLAGESLSGSLTGHSESECDVVPGPPVRSR